mmetsp:Transcript_11343/g.17839  ORF Transcript_11343/g.17839 Transcript_11343/m.17839 type:complete len:163 (+) Transcript_11343:70-558(+)
MKNLDDIKMMQLEFQSICGSHASNTQKSGELKAWNNRFRAHIKEHVEHCQKHFADEESMFATTFKNEWNEEACHKMEQMIIKKNGLVATRIALPAIVAVMYDWAGSEFQANFLKKLPYPIRSMVTGPWMREFEEVNVQLMKSLTLHYPLNIKEPHPACCSVS